MLEVDKLIFEYPGKRVLHNLTFSIKKGSITVLIGPNGAGKTTLIRCMTALTSPYSGRVFFNGEDVHADPVAAHRKMGYLPDFFGLYDALSVANCLRYAAMAQGVSDEKITEAVKISAQRLGLDDRMNELAGDLSRGLKQRLAIAQAIIHQPEFLVLDEPASGLDPDARIELSKLFKQLRNEGMTLLVSSHILAELEDYATEMIVLRDGKIVGQKPFVGGERFESKRLIVKLANKDNRTSETVLSFTEVSELVEESNIISFNFNGDVAAQSQILKKLVETGIPVIEFREGTERLHDAYLASIKGDLANV